jgi:glutathione S-transferase
MPGVFYLPRTRSTRVLWLLEGGFCSRVTELEGPLFRWRREMRDNPSDTPPSRERFADAATALENAIGAGSWLLGDDLTAADIICLSILSGAHSHELLSDWPGLQAYVERGQARPAFAASQAR